MLVLDTSILSRAFRRRNQQEEETAPVKALRKLIAGDLPLFLPGIVLQELLSGIRGESEFKRLEFMLRGFSLLIATRENHVAAARIANSCRPRGIQTSAPDCLIAAQTIAQGAQLFTLDEDFARMAPCCGLRLLQL